MKPAFLASLCMVINLHRDPPNTHSNSHYTRHVCVNGNVYGYLEGVYTGLLAGVQVRVFPFIVQFLVCTV